MSAQPGYSQSVGQTPHVIDLAYHHNKGLAGRNVNLECLIRIRGGATVSNPVGAEVARIEAPQISRCEDVMEFITRRIGIDRHALRRAGCVRERVRIVMVHTRIPLKDPARRTRRTGLRYAAVVESTRLHGITIVKASSNHDRSAGGATSWRRRRRASATDCDRPDHHRSIIGERGLNRRPHVVDVVPPVPPSEAHRMRSRFIR